MLKVVGTIHTDPWGRFRTKDLLDKYQPKKITVECPRNYTIQEIRELSDLMQEYANNVSSLKIPEFTKHLLIEDFRNRYFDIIVPIQYMDKKNINCNIVSVDFVDVPEYEKHIFRKLSNKEIESSFEKFPAEIIQQLEKIQSDELMEIMDQSYFDLEFLKKITSFLPSPYAWKDLTDPELAEKREEYMAQKITDIKPDMHIAGLGHVFESHYKGILVQKPLYERLKESNVFDKIEKIRLCEIDKLY